MSDQLRSRPANEAPGQAQSTAQTDAGACPSAFRYWQGIDTPGARRAARLVYTLTGKALFPPEEKAQAFCADLYGGDPVAERFVNEVFDTHGHTRTREMLETAVSEGIDAVEDPPDSMRELFTEFEHVPDWVDPQLLDEGAAIWRRWGTMLFAVAGVTTLEIYTEAAVALPLSLTGGYAGDNALRRFLETGQFWIDVSEPGALLRQGSAGRATAMHVRVMHVSVRRRVSEHPEWDADRWGLPICQAYMLLTLLGGSVAPALALWLTGIQTTPREMRALLHFQRYLGHLLGVQPRWFPGSVWECVQMLSMTIAARSYDAGEHGAELIESFPEAFAPSEDQRGLRKLRAQYNYRIYAGYLALWMAPRTRKRYKLPPAFPWVLLPLLRAPLVGTFELARRAVPGLARIQDRVTSRHRARWLAEQTKGRKAEFNADRALRR